MSIMINNRNLMTEKEKARQEILKKIILELHNGASKEDVKERFRDLIEGVSAGEISEMEQSLINDGMAVEEIQRLCDVHADIFKGSIEEIHSITNEEDRPGHPVRVLKDENKAITKLINEEVLPLTEKFIENSYSFSAKELSESLDKLIGIDRHYKIKENILFPYMEKYSISAPPKVMWGVDDEIRESLKSLKEAADRNDIDYVAKNARPAYDRILDMIFKEENILLPMLIEKLTEDEWVTVMHDARGIGFTLIDEPVEWKATRFSEKAADYAVKDGVIHFETGNVSLEAFESIMKLLPVDLTFIDENDIVRFFSEGKRVFPRTKSVLGRTVQNCHPPKSVHVVEKILSDFKSGVKDSEDFWIQAMGMFIYIRYFAVRNPEGKYLGTLEVTQEITGIRNLEGEKRLLSE